MHLIIKNLIKALIFIIVIAGLVTGFAMLILRDLYRPPPDECSAAICISGNSEFKQIVTSGNGTLDDPYIVDSLNFTTTEFQCIFIEEVRGLFIIFQNCTFDAESIGLELYFCSANFIIRNCTFLDNILFSFVSNVMICNSYFEDDIAIFDGG
ncbi:MAG: hypothetical protein ACXABJ_03515, partial [Candidatus Heimdallarchaeaceae archaeon]